MKKKKKRNRKAKTKNPTSDRIDLNRDRIYRISDPIQLAQVFYPAKNAHQRRAAFLGILFEIKNSKDQRLASTDHIAQKYGLPLSIISKVRAKMKRIGLIRRRDGNWIFSSTFSTTMQKLEDKLKDYQVPAHSLEERKREDMFIDIVKASRK